MIFVIGILLAISFTNVYGDESNDNLESFRKLADTPTLHVYGESASAHNYPFVEFSYGQLEWLDRVVKEKVVLMSESDISQYLELIGHNEIQVKYIGDDRTIKYYALRLSDPGLNLAEHNVRAFYQYFTPTQFTKIQIDEDDIPQYLRHILQEREWATLTEQQYQELKQHMEKNGPNYQVNEKNHAPNYWIIAYIGPELEEVKQGLFENRDSQIDVLKSINKVTRPDANCTPVTSHNAANEVIPYYERFSVTDNTGKEIRRISQDDSVIVRYNPYNDWAEHDPYVFEFGISYFDGNQDFTIYTNKNTINESLCDYPFVFEWQFVPEPGSYELFIDRINSGDNQDIDRRISVDEFETYNALTQESDFLEQMNTQSFTDTLYKITSVGSGNIGLNIEEVVWSPDGSFIIFKQHDRCHYIDDPQCISESLWMLRLTQGATLEKIPLSILEQHGNVDELKISPDGSYLLMRGYYTEQNGKEYVGVYLYDFESQTLTQIIDIMQTHVMSFDWMSDGTILYHEAIQQRSGILWNIDKEGNVLEKIYEGQPNFGYMDVSPDGTMVSFRALEKEPGRSPPPDRDEFDPPGTLRWFDISTKEFFEGKIQYNLYGQTQWSPDNEYLYYLGVRPSPPIIGKLNVDTDEDTQIVISDKPYYVSSTFSLNPDGNLMAFALHRDITNEYEKIMIMDVQNPSHTMSDISESSIKGIECGFGTVLLNEQCVSERFAEQQGCAIVNGKCVMDSKGLENSISIPSVFDPNPNDFQKGETLNSSAIIIIQSIGAILIVGFIVFYAIKKRRAKQID